MKQVTPASIANEINEKLPKGIFLNTKADGKVDTMIIGWGAVGNVWGKPVMMVMVRKSRYTKTLLDKSMEFTVSIPMHDMRKAIGICGTKSGRDIDKFAEAALTAQPGQKIDTPVIADAGLHIECKVVYHQDMLPKNLDKVYTDRWYDDNDWHTLYYGEIVAAYRD